MRERTTLVAVSLMALAALVLPSIASAASLDPAPVWQNETLMGPARQTAELIKAKFTFVSQTKKLTFKLGQKSVEMTLGSKTAKIGGKTVTLPEAPKALNGTTYIPLKNVLVGLGSEIKSGGANAWIICVNEMCIRLEVPSKPA